MDGKNKIIQRILDDAETKCKDILAKAHSDKEQAIATANDNASTAQDMLVVQCDIDAKATVANALSNAKLEINKYRLASKQGMIDDVYTKVAQELHALPAKQYLALITKLIKTHAEQGEMVTISGKDSAVITPKYLAQFDLGLTLSPEHGDFDGGVVLSCDKYDKVLTLDRIVEDIRRTTDSAVAKMLFGD